MSIASARDEIRRRRKLVPIGPDPLLGPWRILSTSGDYSHELRKDGSGEIRCDTCMSRYGRLSCWASARVVQSLGQARPEAPSEPDEPAVGSLSWRQTFDAAASAKRHPGPV